MSGVAIMPTRSTRKPKGEGHSRRAEILAAAERIFVEHGYEGATIRKIAEEVGLSSTALYMHFSEKSEILHEICRGAFDKLRVSHMSIRDEAAPAEVRLRRMIESYVRFGFEHPNAYRLIYLTRPSEAREGAEDAAQALGAELFASFEALVEEAATDSGQTVDVRAYAQTIWAGGHGVVSLMITKPYFDWVDRDLLIRTTLDAVFSGLFRPARQ